MSGRASAATARVARPPKRGAVDGLDIAADARGAKRRRGG